MGNKSLELDWGFTDAGPESLYHRQTSVHMHIYLEDGICGFLSSDFQRNLNQKIPRWESGEKMGSSSKQRIADGSTDWASCCWGDRDNPLLGLRASAWIMICYPGGLKLSCFLHLGSLEFSRAWPELQWLTCLPSFSYVPPPLGTSHLLDHLSEFLCSFSRRSQPGKLVSQHGCVREEHSCAVALGALWWAVPAQACSRTRSTCPATFEKEQEWKSW